LFVLYVLLLLLCRKLSLYRVLGRRDQRPVEWFGTSHVPLAKGEVQFCETDRHEISSPSSFHNPPSAASMCMNDLAATKPYNNPLGGPHVPPVPVSSYSPPPSLLSSSLALVSYPLAGNVQRPPHPSAPQLNSTPTWPRHVAPPAGFTGWGRDQGYRARGRVRR